MPQPAGKKFWSIDELGDLLLETEAHLRECQALIQSIAFGHLWDRGALYRAVKELLDKQCPQWKGESQR